MAELFLLEENFCRSYLEKRESIDINSSEYKESFFLFSQNKSKTDILNIDGDSAFINIKGRLSLDGPDFIDSLLGVGGTSYNDIIAAVKRVKNDDSVKNVILKIDSPGGSIYGTDETWNEIKNLVKVKNVETHFSLLASSALWIASSTKIIATSDIAEIGSIGVVAGIKKYVNDRVKIKTITSKNAPDKNPDLFDKKGEKILQNQINAIERVFISRMASGRNVTEEYVKTNFGKGGVLIARDPDASMPSALKAGLVDGVMGGLPAASKNTREQKEANMSQLKDFLENNPEAKSEYEENIKNAKQEGRAEVQKKIEKAKFYLTSEYPDHIKKMVAEYIEGDLPFESLDACVRTYDLVRESIKSEAAKIETSEIGDVPVDDNGISADGVIRNEKDYQHEIERTKKLRGVA